MVTVHEQTLINALMERQARLQLSSGDMARRLRISPSLWSMTRRHKKRVGRRILEGVMREFPEFTPEAILVLRANVADITVDGYSDNDGGRKPAVA